MALLSWDLSSESQKSPIAASTNEQGQRTPFDTSTPSEHEQTRAFVSIRWYSLIMLALRNHRVRKCLKTFGSFG